MSLIASIFIGLIIFFLGMGCGYALCYHEAQKVIAEWHKAADAWKATAKLNSIYTRNADQE